MMKNIKVIATNSDNILDRIQLCWGHLDDWKNQKIVQKTKIWLEKANALSAPTSYIAYDNKTPVGFVEFIPQKLMKKLGLCPCRIDIENSETEDRYILGKAFENYLFISCFFVKKESQNKGIGTFLLNHLLNSNVFRNSDGALVYVAEKNVNWENYIYWPAGPKEFYFKAGFVIKKTLNNPTGYLLSYTNTKQRSL
jgi:GNAT superfamily N-acetyltransferase